MRVILIAACVVISIVELARNHVSTSLLFFIVAGLFAYGYFRYGPVWLLSKYVKKGQTAKAEKLLGSVRNPLLLSAQQRAYYYFYKGVVEDSKNSFDVAESCYRQALDAGLRTKNDEAIANLNLASIYYRQGKLDEARERLKQASELPHKPAVDAEIEELRSELNGNKEA
jgi:tetratricopeptide (TPR) repeat protein